MTSAQSAAGAEPSAGTPSAGTPSARTTSAGTPRRGGVATAIGAGTAVAIIAVLLLSWFAWPAKELAPRGLPVVVAGPPPAAAALADRLRSAEPGAFEVTTVADAAAADQALKDRQAYAAFIVGPGGVELHTASGASPVVATVLSQAAQRLRPPTPPPGGTVAATGEVTVTDVVPGGPDDPRGTGFAAGFLPLVLAGLVAGIAFSVAVAGKAARLVGLVVFAVVAGLAGAAIMDGMGLTRGSYLGVAGGIGLLSLAVSAAVAGLAAALGRAGIGLGVLAVFLLGNPISAVTAAPELLPEPWGAVGQLLPPGAGGSLLRSLAFFDGAGSASPLWTLVAWSAGGLVLLAMGRSRVAAEVKL